MKIIDDENNDKNDLDHHQKEIMVTLIRDDICLRKDYSTIEKAPRLSIRAVFL